VGVAVCVMREPPIAVWAECGARGRSRHSRRRIETAQQKGCRRLVSVLRSAKGRPAKGTRAWGASLDFARRHPTPCRGGLHPTKPACAGCRAGTKAGREGQAAAGGLGCRSPRLVGYTPAGRRRRNNVPRTRRGIPVAGAGAFCYAKTTRIRAPRRPGERAADLSRKGTRLWPHWPMNFASMPRRYSMN
jgi:hypothetical protein